MGEKKEIDSEQHTFLKDLLDKRDKEEKNGDATSKWWHNLFEKKFDGNVPYWAKDGHQDVNMNWKWSAAHAHSHSHTKTHTQTIKTIRGGKHDSSDSESSDSESSEGRADMGRPMDMMKPLISSDKKHFKPLVARAANLRGDSDDSDSSDNALLI